MEEKMKPDSEDLELPTKDKKPAWPDDEKNNITSFKNLLKPFLFSMALAGCYNFSDINTLRKTSAKSVLSVTYRAVVLIFVLLNLAKVVAAFFFLPTNYVMFNGLICSWLISLVATYFLNLKATSLKYGHLEKAFVFWEEELVPEFQDLNIKFPKASIEKRTKIVLVVAWFLVLGNVTSIGVQMYLSGPELFTSPFAGTPAMIVVTLTLVTIASTMWILPVVYVSMINKIIYEAFSAFNESWGTYCAKQGCKMAEDFQRVRLLHMKLCQLVTDLDQDIGLYYAATITFSVGIAVFNLYQLIKTPLTTFEIILLLFWLVSVLFICILLSAKAAYVNDAAHAPLDRIYYINVTDITVEKLAQLNLFLSKLTGTQVGFSTCGLIIITKEFILTIAGLFITYFAVLYTL